MSKFLKECLRAQISRKTLVLVTGIWLLLQGTAFAQAPIMCSDSIAPNFPSPINPPNPAVKQAIGDVIAQFGVSLENKNDAILSNILDPNVKFELCSAGGNTQDFLATTGSQVVAYYNDLWPALTTQGLMAHHIVSGIVLSNTATPNEVEGRFTQLVFLQTSIGALNPDYSGTVKATFVKNGSQWQFKSFLLVANIPHLGGGIEARGR